MSYRAVRLAGSTRPANAMGRGGFHLSAGTVSRYVAALAPILKRAEPTPFALEGALRAHVRSRLCLRGWGWPDADAVAEAVLLSALNRIGSHRPSWKEGQPEHTQDGYSRGQRWFCVNCGSRLPEDKFKYCSKNCAWRWQHRIYAHYVESEQRAAREFEDAKP